MAEARQRHDWNQTAAVMALLANIHRDPKRQRAMTPEEFHPMAPRTPPVTVPLRELRDRFTR